jgi:hypothetical protein
MSTDDIPKIDLNKLNKLIALHDGSGSIPVSVNDLRGIVVELATMRSLNRFLWGLVWGKKGKRDLKVDAGAQTDPRPS